MTRPPRPRRPWSPDGVRVEAGPRPHRRRPPLDPVTVLRYGCLLAMAGSAGMLWTTAIVDPMWWWVWALAALNVAGTVILTARVWWMTRRRP